MRTAFRSSLWRWPPLALGLAALVGPGATAPLLDPTRPPPTVLNNAPATPGAPGVAAARPAAAAASAAPKPPALPQLQAVQLPSRGQATAMIDGQLFKLGDTVGDRVVVGIDREGVVLRGGAQGSVRLLLLAAESHKRPPGSITITRSAGFVPAPMPATEGAGRTTLTRSGNGSEMPLDERHDHDNPTGGKTLSVADRTKP